MVFDWFRRRTAPTPQAETAAETPDEQDPGTGSDSDLEAVAPEVANAVVAAVVSEVAEASAAPQDSPAEAASIPPVPAAATAGGVDQEALEWARQAYARLKAQQQAASPAPATVVSAPPSPAVSPSSPADQPAVVPELESGGPESDAAAEAIAAPQPPAASLGIEGSTPAAAAWSAVVAPTEPAAPAALPLADPAPAAPGLSLLEQAAAQRQQRLQELTAQESLATSEALAAPADRPAAASTGTSVPGTAVAVLAGDDPQLGDFDDTFTWSAEVLAAQGRSVEQVSIEEIDWLGRLRRGLEKTRRGFVTQLLDSLGDDPLTPEVIDDLETTLLRADVGVQATDQVLAALRQRLNEEVVDPAEGLRFLKEQLRGLLEAPISASGRELLVPERGRLNVWLLVGVNGVGKTTTLGKLANLAVRSGYSCLIAAADTFRAAAVQQVSVWGERSGVAVISNPSANADPAAVVYDAIGAAQAKGSELVLVDTAGRLQTKHNLMEELAKVRRIIDKLAPEAAVESLLVLDASQGQNGLKQAMAFAQAAGLTGVVLTKLDGSARGGVALAVASEAKLPIRFIGAGETIRDLRPFNSFEFVEALLAS
ncbi:MAG: signal recognition particle-docking protein FtsY [Cyanobacteria bacterium]|nr:signal recognition particle-docking protein FtsY [Cyanobacteriota bacterium]